MTLRPGPDHFGSQCLRAAVAADDELVGTYKLGSEQRKIVDTGEVVRPPNPLGLFSYGKDGRMLVLIVRIDRPKPESVEQMTEQQRADLFPFRSITSYWGTYKFDGVYSSFLR